ncbi:MAG: hypothetical protein C0391_03875 [Anaerolinea sp.]|nr:hypothetical protein [Anaerolinea sp.]
MPELKNRSELEKAIAKAIGGKLSGKTQQLMKLLGDPPELSRVPASFWEELGVDLTSAIKPELKKVFETAAEELIVSKVVGVDWALVNHAASEWASTYTFELVKDINKNSRDALQELISGFFEKQTTLGELEANVEGMFGEYRAALIAVTETTRASTEGEKQTVELIKQDSGIQMKPFFVTMKDETVCDECGPMDGQEITDDSQYAPLHPGCRCSTRYEFEGSHD